MGGMAAALAGLVDHTGVNLAGSVAFGFSAIASYVVPGTAQLLSVPVTNLGTFVGAVCFFIGAILLLFERTEQVHAIRRAAERLTGPPSRPVTPKNCGTSSDRSGLSRSCDGGSRCSR